MPVGQHPFIDVAVHRQVRSRFARGEALVLFAADLGSVLWANGPGAGLFGFATPYELMDEWHAAPSPVRRQLATVASQLAAGGDGRPVTLRIAAGLGSRTISAVLTGLALADGTPAVLLADGTSTEGLDLQARAGRIASGLGDAGTRVAVLDAAGDILAVSPDAARPGIEASQLRGLVGQVADGGSRLVKRLVGTAGGDVAVALARLGDEPPLYLLFVVDTGGEPRRDDARQAEAGVARSPQDTAPAASRPDDAAVARADPPGPGEFAFDPSADPVRFVWKIDARGRFSDLSPEFAAAVGPNAADVIDRSFSDVAKVFGFDRDEEIATLLQRRDTWSGRTIAWPVQGTALSVPVDLAALPIYDRDRQFQGFRGFGIVRIGEAQEDPEAIGLSLAVAPAAPVEAEEPSEASPGGADDGPEAADGDALPGTGEAAAGMRPAGEQAPADAEGTDPFRGETPALTFATPFGRRDTDKVIDLNQRRPQAREILSSGEQQAFREIGQRLAKSFAGDRDKGGTQPAESGRPQPDAAASGDLQASAQPAETDEAKAPDGGAAQAAPPADDAGSRGGGLVRDASRMPSAFATAPANASGRLSEAVVDDLPVAILLHDGHAVYHANPEFFGLTGYRDLAALTDAGGLARLFAAPDLTGELPGAPLPGTLQLVRADGREMPVHARLQSVPWNAGHALMLSLVPARPAANDAPEPVPARDNDNVEALPAPKVAEISPAQDPARVAALKIEVEELRSILETATDGVVILGEHGDVRSVNRSASALFDYDEAEIRGQPFAKLFAHESQRAVMDYLNGLSEHGVASVLNDGREVIGREASGGFLPLFMTIGRLTGSNGFCAVMRDITQWKRTEEELRAAKFAAEQANSHKSEFLARVSHEIRTPLNAIIGFADMMAEERFGPIGNPRYLEYARDIGGSGKHVLDIVNDLLDISKIEAGEMDISFAAVALNDSIAEAVSLLQPQANSQRVIIRTSLSSSVPEVVADHRSIKQIALNLLSNAIRFTPPGGQIVVSTAYEANGSVALRIRDTGVGMSSAELEQAMKPFRQVKGSSRPRGDGTGLGLPLTKAMVEANRAQFEIRSAPNEGTLIEISFPSQRVLAD